VEAVIHHLHAYLHTAYPSAIMSCAHLLPDRAQTVLQSLKCCIFFFILVYKITH